MMPGPTTIPPAPPLAPAMAQKVAGSSLRALIISAVRGTEQPAIIGNASSRGQSFISVMTYQGLINQRFNQMGHPTMRTPMNMRPPTRGCPLDATQLARVRSAWRLALKACQKDNSPICLYALSCSTQHSCHGPSGQPVQPSERVPSGITSFILATQHPVSLPFWDLVPWLNWP